MSLIESSLIYGLSSPENGALPATSIFLQESCLSHQYIRSKDVSGVVERPERLRSVNIGISAVTARFEEALLKTNKSAAEGAVKDGNNDDELVAALEKLELSTSDSSAKFLAPVQVIKSQASINILNNPAVKYIHGDIEGDVYLENLVKWVNESKEKIAEKGTEIPEGFNQGDLYLCPESIKAIQGALGTVCEAVDTILRNSSRIASKLSDTRRAFVAIRPPGHHCGEDTPSGFCFVNNIAVAAAHAHLKYNVNRVVIFDIDLHHGNGTQSIIWQINEETYRKQLEASYGAPSGKPGLQVFYGSIHDILSFPCEDGKVDLVQAASVSIHGPHGQYVENIHLHPYRSEEDFWGALYPDRYAKIFEKANNFIQDTGGVREDTLVFISCGFDACEHEYASMSRHGRKVPVEFYYRFTMDARKFSERISKGRLISVLEGGYSDRALTSGILAHISGLVEEEGLIVDPNWWKLDNLVALEKATKKRKGGRASSTAAPESWLHRAVELFASFNSTQPSTQPAVSAYTMSLRDRTKPVSNEKQAMSKTAGSSPSSPRRKTKKATSKKPVITPSKTEQAVLLGDTAEHHDTSEEDGGQSVQKKLPRVILKLGPAPPS